MRIREDDKGVAMGRFREAESPVSHNRRKPTTTTSFGNTAELFRTSVKRLDGTRFAPQPLVSVNNPSNRSPTTMAPNEKAGYSSPVSFCSGFVLKNVADGRCWWQTSEEGASSTTNDSNTANAVWILLYAIDAHTPLT